MPVANTSTQVASSENVHSWDRGCLEPRRQSIPQASLENTFQRQRLESHGPWWYPYSILLLERSRIVFAEDWNKGRKINDHPLRLSLSLSGPRQGKVRVTQRRA